MKFLGSLFILFGLCLPASANDKFVNIRVNPIGVLAGVANLGADFALTDNFTLGVQGSYIKLSVTDTEATANSYGVAAQYFFTEAFADSWYLGASYEFLSSDAKNKTTNEQASLDGSIVGGVIGYMWMWTNFNIQLGLGFQALKIESPPAGSTINIDDLNLTLPRIDFSLGWAF
ncbi:MAG: DUF3575 domain-containing protein [Bdellovibrionales bacterium]|nr:DUF3575 domain-containing protein [Bdellovibrionales bacterium]